MNRCPGVVAAVTAVLAGLFADRFAGARAQQPAAPVATPAVATAPIATPTPPAPQLRLQLWPSTVQLDDATDLQPVIALLVAADGVTVDPGAAVTWELAAAGIAAIDVSPARACLSPLADGSTELIARCQDQVARVPVTVRRTSLRPPVSFRNDVVPVLTHSGCNAGSCHGAASGKNGFCLSLFGYDPAKDHRVLTRELRGRRVDFAAPEQSLLLQKATAGAPHQGGQRFAAGTLGFTRLRDWIAEGAVDDGDAAPALLGIDVLPDSAVLIGPDRQLPLLVRARYQDGTDRDVTALALWSSSNDGTARVAKDGRVTSRGRGEAVLLARFGGAAAIARVRVHQDDAPFAWPDPPTANFVDRFVHARLRAARTLPAALCSDATFLRRAYLDLLAILPTTAEATAFLDDTATDKRERLIDALLLRPEFAAAQAMAWADVLQVDATTMEKKGAALLGRHLRSAFASGRPFGELVRELVTASGRSFADPAVNYQVIAGPPHLVAEKTAQVFLGVRLQCAQCHNHPFERWTMDDYYGFAAFFGQVGKKRGQDPYEWVVWDRSNGEVRNPRNNAVSAPRLLGRGPVAIPAGTDRRQVLAEWLTKKDNPWFARNVVNRLWARLFGRGLCEPVDDMRTGLPPSHPELLDALARLFLDSGEDVRPVLAAICKSRTWQAAVAPADAEPQLFAGCRPRRLSAEPLLDAIAAVTAVPTKYPDVPLGGPATAIDGGRGSVRFLDAFGRPARDSVCTCDRRDEPTLGQTLHLINGDTIAGKITASGGRLLRALQDKRPAPTMLEDLFLAAYCRRPTLLEERRLLAFVDSAPDPATGWQDLYWSVLNSKEFLFQH